MFIRQFQVEGLGHLSTLIGDEERSVAAVIDPRRDVDVYINTARKHGLTITHAIETHLHNDYVSGGRELAAATGAEQLIGAGAALQYVHRPLRNGESATVGRLRLTVLDTPGHTPEHVAYIVADASRSLEPLLMFTGGSLLVGAVGRTDLLGAEHARTYAEQMFHSLHDTILAHDDRVGVFPTHGAGSLCSTSIGAAMSSTIGVERRTNPLLQPIEVDAFARLLLAGQPAVPRYFARMRGLNQAGPKVLGRIPAPAEVSLDAASRLLRAGGALVDLRSPAAFARAHIQGSLSIPAGSSFGTWLGWVVDLDQPVVFVLPASRAASDPDTGSGGLNRLVWDDAIRQALRIGHDSVAGYLAGGLGAWAQAGLPIDSNGRLGVAALARSLGRGGPESPLVIDVRQMNEFAEGHLAGAWHLGAGDLPGRLADLPRDQPIATICASGYRASVAASLLDAAGFTNVSSVAGGVDAWATRGLPLERSRA